jgi:hypothetical protein
VSSCRPGACFVAAPRASTRPMLCAHQRSSTGLFPTSGISCAARPASWRNLLSRTSWWGSTCTRISSNPLAAGISTHDGPSLCSANSPVTCVPVVPSPRLADVAWEPTHVCSCLGQIPVLTEHPPAPDIRRRLVAALPENATCPSGLPALCKTHITHYIMSSEFAVPPPRSPVVQTARPGQLQPAKQTAPCGR